MKKILSLTLFLSSAFLIFLGIFSFTFGAGSVQNIDFDPTASPSCTASTTGRLYYSETSGLRLCSGSAWGGIGGVATTTWIWDGGTFLYPSSTNWYVGIGTTSPAYALDVVTGNGRFVNPVFVGSPTNAGHAMTKSYADTNFKAIFSILPISEGGTGAATSSNALNNLLPSQGSNSGKYLTTDGTDASWGTVVGGGTNYFSLSGTNLSPTSTTYKLGIGTASPSSTLHVYGTSTFTGGNVGINTTPNATPLSVQALTSYAIPTTNTRNGTFSIGNTTNAYGMMFGVDTATGKAWISSQRFSGGAANYALMLNPLGSYLMVGTSTVLTTAEGSINMGLSTGMVVIKGGGNQNTELAGDHLKIGQGTGLDTGYLYFKSDNTVGATMCWGKTSGACVSFANTNFIPSTNLGFTLGHSSYRWNGLYSSRITDNATNVGLLDATSPFDVGDGRGLHIKSTSTATLLLQAYNGAGYTSLSSQVNFYYSANSQARILYNPSTATFTISNEYYNTSAGTAYGNINFDTKQNGTTTLASTAMTIRGFNGFVGIATTTPVYTLDVAGTGSFTQPVFVGTPTAGGHATTKDYVDSAAGGGGNWFLTGSTLSASSTAWDITFGDGVGTDLTVGSGAGKIDVGTVDPVYTIGGKHYATYMSGMTGVKEETVGIINIKCQNSNVKNCVTIIDFKNAEIGSDIWLFGKTTNLQKNFANLSVLLTPEFDGRVWYKKDAENMRIMIYGSEAGEVSYRLTAPRFDAEDWKNIRTDDAEGFNLDKLIRN